MASLGTPQDVLGAIATVVGGVARGAIMPSEDWALISHIVGRTVGPEEAVVLYEDEEFWGEVEALAASADGGKTPTSGAGGEADRVRGASKDRL